MATPDLLRSDVPIWTQEDFAQHGREASLRQELVGYHPDEELLDGKTPRAHLEELVGEEVAAQLISV